MEKAMTTGFQIGDRVEYWRTGVASVRRKYRGTVTGFDSPTCLAVRSDDGSPHHVPLNVDDVMVVALEVA